jgi:DNA-binding LacI/PurR family transcriptional regulator
MLSKVSSATIYDVAKVAGVSHQTVSRYLRGSSHVAPETAKRVQAALEALDYKLNSAARFLREGRVNRLGVLAHRLDLSGPVRLLNGLTNAARRSGYLLDIAAVDGNDPEDVRNALDLLLGQQVAGVLAVAQSSVVVEAIEQRRPGVPIVSDVTVEGESPLNEVAGRLAAEHLLELGHRRVAYLSGPLTWPSARLRADAFTRTFLARGGSVAWRAEGDWTADSAYALARRIPIEELAISAVGVGNDSMAIAVVSALLAQGWRVPEDVSVVGTDDSAESRYLNPPLTTVSVDQEGEGVHMFASLVARIEDLPASAVPALRVPVLLARGSTAPASATRR